MKQKKRRRSLLGPPIHPLAAAAILAVGVVAGLLIFHLLAALLAR